MRHPQGQVRGAGVLGARHLSVRGVQVPPDGGGGVLGEILPGVPGEKFQKFFVKKIMGENGKISIFDDHKILTPGLLFFSAS